MDNNHVIIDLMIQAYLDPYRIGIDDLIGLYRPVASNVGNTGIGRETILINYLRGRILSLGLYR